LNEASTDRCAACGFPSSASGAEIEAARTERERAAKSLKSSTECPACSGIALVEGTLSFSGDDSWVTFFHPKRLRFLSFWKTVSLENGQAFTACLDCGHVWSAVDPARLRELLEKNGNAETLKLIGRKKDISPSD